MRVFTGVPPIATTENSKTAFLASFQRKFSATLKRFICVAFLVMMMFSSQISWGQLLTQDFGFSGALTANGWIAHSGAATNAISTTNGLSYTGALGSGVGNAALVNNLGGEDINISFANQSGNGTSVYYSFMVNITDAAASKTGDYFLHIGTPGGASFSSFAGRVFAKITTGVVNFGLSNTSTPAYGTTGFAKNTTYLVIVKYTINTGGNDVVSMWVKSSGVPATEPLAGAPEVTSSTTAGQDQINTVALRQGSATASPQTVVDGIRVGTTWTDVTAGAAAPVVTPASPTGTVGTLFSYNIVASNSPTSYAVSSGTLPPGLTLTLATGLISGTPTTAGITSVDVTATNGVGTSAPATLNFSINPGNQTITGLAANDTRTYGDAPYNLTATGGGSGNPVTYSSSPAGVVTIVGNQVTIVGAGTTTITASQAGNTNWIAATDVPQSLTVNKAAQTITFGTLINRNDIDPNFQLTATGGASGNPITYTSSLTSVAEIVDGAGSIDPNGDWVEIIAAGSTTITASQAGNANYFAATPVPQVQVINSTSLLPQTIIGLPLTDTRTYGDANYQLTATGGGSGNPVTYQSLNTAVATIVDNLGNLDPNGTYVHLVSNGVATIRASQAGNGTYNPAPDVDQVLTVNQKEITVSGAVANDKPYDATNAATISGYTVNGIVGTDIVTVSGGGTFASVDAGTHPVTAALVLGGTDQSKYYLTQPILADATITQLSQIITGLPFTDTRTFGAVPYNLAATGGASGNSVTYSASPAGVVTIAGNLVTIIGGGVTTITASQAGSTNYSAAADVFQTLTVNQATQTITFAALANRTTADLPFALAATASSTLPVSYSSSNPAVADVVGNLVTIYSAGFTVITASQAGDANYLPATNVTRTLIITAPLIAAWDFTGPGNIATSAATTFNVDLGSSNLITRGITAGASAGANSFRSTGFKNEGIAVTNTDYFQTTLSAVAGKQLSLSDITGRYNGTTSFFATPGVTSQFAYSLDGTTFTLIGSPVTSTSLVMLPVDLTTISALQNVPSGTTVTIRYYASGQTLTGGWGFFSNAVADNGLAFGGSITCSSGISTADFRTKGTTGNFSDATTWEYQNGCGNWVDATQAPSAGNRCVCRAGFSGAKDLLSAPMFIKSLVVESGASLAIESDLTVSGGGTVLGIEISGNVTLIHQGRLLTPGDAPINIQSGAVVMIHQGRLLDASGAPVNIGTGGKIISEGIVQIGGNLTVNGQYDGALGELTFNGTLAQVLDHSPVLASPPSNFGEVVYDNPSIAGVTVQGNSIPFVSEKKEFRGHVTLLRRTTARQSLTIEATGILEIPGSTELSVGGDWMNNGGTFIPGTGKVIFDGTVTSHIGGTTATETFYDLETSCTDLINDKTTLNVQNLKITAGKFTGGPGTVTLKQNMTIHEGAIFDPNLGTLVFDGTVEQELNDGMTSTGPRNIAVHNLSINNGSDFKIDTYTCCGLGSGRITLTGELTLIAGKIKLNSELFISTGANIIGASPSKYIVTNGKGTVIHVLPVNDAPIVYPIGTATGYSPVTLRHYGSSGQTLAIGERAEDGVSTDYDANDNPIGSPIISRNVLKTFFASGDIPVGDHIKMQLQWNTADEASNFNRAVCNLGHFTGGQWTYSKDTTAVLVDNTGSYKGEFSATVTALSPFAVFSQSILTSITGTTLCAGDNVTVNYSVSEGIWDAGNIFTAQLSDATGSFASAVNIGSIAATTSGAISAIIPISTTAGTGYRIRVLSSDPVVIGDDNGTNLTVNVCATIVTVNLKLYLQGYYINGGSMQTVLANQGVGASATDVDNIIIELHDANTFALVEAQAAVLQTTGLVSATFTQPPALYYIAIKHRNSIQTWSTDPVDCEASTPLYDFTTAASKALGDNQVEVETDVWALFSGDINQDDFIDSNDFPDMDTDILGGLAFIYAATDLNGDGFVDSNDFPVLDNNIFNGIAAILP